MDIYHVFPRQEERINLLLTFLSLPSVQILRLAKSVVPQNLDVAEH